MRVVRFHNRFVNPPSPVSRVKQTLCFAEKKKPGMRARDHTPEPTMKEFNGERKTNMKIACTLLLEFLTCGALLAGQPIPDSLPFLTASSDEVDAAKSTDASFVIFSNLDSTPGDRYDADIGFPVAGKDAPITEESNAIRFVPKVDVQAQVLMAAVTYTSGTKLVDLGIYSNNDLTGSVGDPLPGGQGSTSQIPGEGECCQLAKVTLAGAGVSLTAGTAYWLVASADASAPTFRGAWQLSELAAYASFSPDIGWIYPNGQWPAAEIRGSKIQISSQGEPTKTASSNNAADVANVTIFSNLNRISDPLFSFGAGVPIDGNDVLFEKEEWQALPFTPKTDVHARTLAAAIAWVSGDKLVRLGVYTDNDGEVGTPLPGGQASTMDIPDLGTCCDLAKVRLPGAGVALSAGVHYWLVASPDNVNAPTFSGVWQQSILAVNAYEQPELGIGWTSASGLWLAAEIRGTSP